MSRSVMGAEVNKRIVHGLQGPFGDDISVPEPGHFADKEYTADIC